MIVYEITLEYGASYIIISDILYDQMSSFTIKLETIVEYMAFCLTISDIIYDHPLYYI